MAAFGAPHIVDAMPKDFAAATPDHGGWVAVHPSIQRLSD